jgi:hypothetical protein
MYHAKEDKKLLHDLHGGEHLRSLLYIEGQYKNYVREIRYESGDWLV